MIGELISGLVTFLVSIMSTLGYFGIFILMAIESSIIPLPSELVLPPAGVLIAQGDMNLWFVLIASILGSLAGALVNYFLAFHFGRKITEKLVHKYGKFLFLTDESLKNSENYFYHNGAITTFIGRLLPGIRHLISIPAGFAKMNLLKFSFYTALGAGIWSLVLIAVGYIYGNNSSIIIDMFNKVGWIVVLIILILILAYFIIKKLRGKK